MDQDEIQRVLAAAQQAQRSGRAAEAARLWQQVLAQAGEHPPALNALGMSALAAQDFTGAIALFQRATAADPQAPELYLNLAGAHRHLHDDPAERAALEGALALDQRHFMATVRLAELFARTGDAARAAERWSTPTGSVRIAATFSLTFMPSSIPPMPGLAPWPRTISMASARRTSSGLKP